MLFLSKDKDKDKDKKNKKKNFFFSGLEVMDPLFWGRPQIVPDDTPVDEDAAEYSRKEAEKNYQELLHINKMIELTQNNPKLIKTSEKRIIRSREAVRNRVKWLRSPLDYKEPWAGNPLIDQVSCGACGSKNIDVIYFGTFDPIFKVHYYIVENKCSDCDKFSLWEQYRSWDV